MEYFKFNLRNLFILLILQILYINVVTSKAWFKFEKESKEEAEDGAVLKKSDKNHSTEKNKEISLNKKRSKSKSYGIDIGMGDPSLGAPCGVGSSECAQGGKSIVGSKHPSDENNKDDGKKKGEKPKPSQKQKGNGDDVDNDKDDNANDSENDVKDVMVVKINPKDTDKKNEKDKREPSEVNHIYIINSPHVDNKGDLGKLLENKPKKSPSNSKKSSSDSDNDNDSSSSERKEGQKNNIDGEDYYGNKPNAANSNGKTKKGIKNHSDGQPNGKNNSPAGSGPGGQPNGFGPGGQPNGFGPGRQPNGLGPGRQPNGFGPDRQPNAFGPGGQPNGFGPGGYPSGFGPGGQPTSFGLRPKYTSIPQPYHSNGIGFAHQPGHFNAKSGLSISVHDGNSPPPNQPSQQYQSKPPAGLSDCISNGNTGQKIRPQPNLLCPLFNNPVTHMLFGR